MAYGPMGGSIGGGFGVGISGASVGGGGSRGMSTSVSGPSPQLLSMYQSEYTNALNFMNKDYQNIIGAYTQTVPKLFEGGREAKAAYETLGTNILDTLKGTEASRLQEIQDFYARERGAGSQSLVNRGLSNTTVMEAINRGLAYDQTKSETSLANQMAQLRAGVQERTGGAGIGAMQRAYDQFSGLSNAYLGVLGSQRIPFPNWPPNVSTSTSFSGSMQGGGGGGGGTGFRANYPSYKPFGTGDYPTQPHQAQPTQGYAPGGLYAYDPTPGYSYSGGGGGGYTAINQDYADPYNMLGTASFDDYSDFYLGGDDYADVYDRDYYASPYDLGYA